jgi:hypothetical protein
MNTRVKKPWVMRADAEWLAKSGGMIIRHENLYLKRRQAREDMWAKTREL